MQKHLTNAATHNPAEGGGENAADDGLDNGSGALDQADVAYSANSFMAVVKPVTLCMTLSALITVSLYKDTEGATNRCVTIFVVVAPVLSVSRPGSATRNTFIVSCITCRTYRYN